MMTCIAIGFTSCPFSIMAFGSLLDQDHASGRGRQQEREAEFEVASTMLWASIEGDLKKLCHREGVIQTRQTQLKKAVKQWLHSVAHPHPVRQSSSGSML